MNIGYAPSLSLSLCNLLDGLLDSDGDLDRFIRENRARIC